MREVLIFVLGGILGVAFMAFTTHPIYQERDELRDTLNRVTIELDGRNIVIDWSDFLKKN